MDNFDAAHKTIEKTVPKLIFLSGKTSTGKTTFASTLAGKYNVKLIELDMVIRTINAPADINKYVSIYRQRDEQELIAQFVKSVRHEIDEAQKNHSMVVLDGALANTETLQEIIHGWTDSFLFIYLEPVDLDLYAERLTGRFRLASPTDNSGLPSSFWKQFTKDELDTYYSTQKVTATIKQGIYAYAAASALESAARLKMFKDTFPNILVIEV